MKKICLSALIIFVIIFALMPTVQAQSPQQTLNQYISDLQKYPNDNVLREKIIKYVETMRPTPSVPEQARRYMNRGLAAAEGAKSENDYKDAAEEFLKAVNIAPWLGSGYRNIAVVQDKAGQYSQALQNIKLYLLTNPPAADAEAAKALMDKIEYRQEKAAKGASPEEIAAKKQKEQQGWLQKLDGARFTSDDVPGGVSILDIRGAMLVEGVKCLPSNVNCAAAFGYGYRELRQDEIHGREVNYSIPGPWGNQEITIRISENGNSITKRILTHTSDTTSTFHRER
jgi:tetratricopeptide (TPR) repeat protein